MALAGEYQTKRAGTLGSGRAGLIEVERNLDMMCTSSGMVNVDDDDDGREQVEPVKWRDDMSTQRQCSLFLQIYHTSSPAP